MINDALFFENFVFTEFCFTAFRHNDISKGLSLHYIAYMREGSCNIVGENYSFRINEGDFFYLPKNFKYHSYWSVGDSGVVRFDSYGFKTLPRRDNIVYLPQKISPFEQAISINQKLAVSKSTDLYSIGLFYQLLGALINRMTCVPENRKSAIVQKAEAFMRENSDYKAADIARHCRISETGLYDAFKEVRGYTPVVAKHKIIVARACELLMATDMSVEEISSRLGFGNAAYFRKIFFRETQKTPREVRRESVF
ncbi:MAG: helix-turn-helix transcriptional regulator [Clostridia bacterium]|nr:helix-turn-helix transcriptional regulator [Clostridia bacterium]